MAGLPLVSNAAYYPVASFNRGLCCIPALISAESEGPPAKQGNVMATVEPRCWDVFKNDCWKGLRPHTWTLTNPQKAGSCNAYPRLSLASERQ